MSRGIVIRNLTGAHALECESDYDVLYQLRTDNGADPAVDTGPFSLVNYDPSGSFLGGGFRGQLRNQEGGTLLAEAVVTMEGTRAVGTLTVATVPTDTDTVTIGSTVYQFLNTPLAAYDVQIGATPAISLANLIAAINLDGDPSGNQYHADTLPHDDVIAVLATATTLRAEAKTGGTQGNSIASTETLTDVADVWLSPTLSGGSGREGFRVHFDGEDLPVTLITAGRSRRCTFDVFGIQADASAVKIATATANLHSSSTQPHVAP